MRGAGVRSLHVIIIGGLSTSLNAALDATAARLLAVAVDARDTVDPNTLAFLLRHYADTGRDAVRDALGEALAPSFTRADAATTVAERAAWLILFAEVRAISDDDRLTPIASRLAASLRRDWNASADIVTAMTSVDACLRAAAILDAHALVPAAIDELERVVGRAYEPGEGLGGFEDHVCAASTLLTAFDLSGRVPYSMLAEELMQIARRQSGDAIYWRCGAARVLCRLAALHRDDGYRAAAVIAQTADYKADAERLLVAAASDAAVARETEAAAYGLALIALLEAP